MTMISPLLAGLTKVSGEAGAGTKPDLQAAADPLFAALLAMMFAQPPTGIPVLPLQPEGEPTANLGGAVTPTATGTNPTQPLLAQVAGQLQQLVAALNQQATTSPDGNTAATEFLAKLATVLQGQGQAQLGLTQPDQTAPTGILPAPLADLQELVVKLEQAVPPVGRTPDPAALGQVLDLMQKITAAQPETATQLVATLTQAPPEPETAPAEPLVAKPKLEVQVAAAPTSEEPDEDKQAANAKLPGAPPVAETTKASPVNQSAQVVRTGRVRAAVENTGGKAHEAAVQAGAVRPQAANAAFAVDQSDKVLPPAGRLATLSLTPDRLVEAVVNAAQNAPPGRYSVAVRLVPEHLGEVRLQLQIEGNKVQAVMQVSNAGAQRALEEHGEQLRQGLDQRGLQLTGFSVSTGSQNQTPQDRQNQLDDWRQAFLQSGLPQVKPTQVAPVPAREITPSPNGRRGNRLDTLA